MEPTQRPPDGSHTPTVWATPPRGELDRFTQVRAADGHVEVGHLLTQFNRASPVRAIAEGLLGNTYRPDTSVLPLFSALACSSSHRWREQVVSAWALARVPLDTQERDAAGGMLQEALERDDDETLWERFLHGLLWGYGSMLPICLMWSIFICRSGENVEWADVFPQMLFTLGSMASVLTVPVCLLCGRLNSRHTDHLRAASAESLGRLHVVESIGSLAERLFDASPAVTEACACALMEILPRLTEEDYGAIDHHAVCRLAEALHHPNSLLVFKVLEALKKVGTGHTLPAVERVAREGKTRRLQETARSVASVLESRVRREREARHLMRPTSAPHRQTDEMFRNTEQVSVNLQTQTSGSGDRVRDEWL